MARRSYLSEMADVCKPPLQSAQELLSELYREDFDVSQSGQTQRLLAHFEANPNKEVDAPTLNVIGSGKPHGYMNSFSKRISECRIALERKGGRLMLTKNETIDGQRHTGYTYATDEGQKCTCGEPHISHRVVHRYDGKPCYISDP